MHCLTDILRASVRVLRDKPYIIFGRDVITYAQFDALTARLAHVLASREVGRGDPVGLYLPSIPLMPVAFWACQKLGAIAVPMSSMYRQSELKGVAWRTGMKVMIAHAETVEHVDPLRGELTNLQHVLVAGVGGKHPDALEPLMDAASSTFEAVSSAPEDVAALFFTSGTTGLPKGTMQTQLNQCSALRDMMCNHRTRFGQEKYLCAAPLFSNLGLTVMLNLCLFTGGTVVLLERWETEKVLGAITEHKITLFGGTPTMFTYLLDGFDASRHDLSSLRLCFTGGSPVSPVTLERFERLSGAPLLQVYGATEGTGQSVAESMSGVRRRGSTGLPVGSADVLIVDENGNRVPHGTLGEVVIAGDGIAKGYWRDPEATAAAFRPQGWVSGDIGYLDEDGYLFIMDRKKDVILAGGHNIYPVEIESVLYSCPGIAVCAVIGLPDEIKGEIPVAVIVRSQGSGVSGEDILRHCRAQIAAYKIPRRVYFVDRMPEGAGKIRKRELIEAISRGEFVPAWQSA